MGALVTAANSAKANVSARRLESMPSRSIVSGATNPLSVLRNTLRRWLKAA